ncbi:type II secretion system F family protein [Nocardioides massiliensis]|uniref:Tight adherence protein B n=1 Tax=Nocardioides massiliensis TaxID=1325935 RepID=A0ABT9NTF0_9ACTN|nr:type II secretion system F family protein [Nocardioides massiliensis]MDP9823562.1 tight adherence protein B [Nocardioides massiliensis]
MMLRHLASLLLLLALLGAGAAYAVPTPGLAIDHVEPGDDTVRVLVSVPAGVEVDPATVTVSLDGQELAATAEQTDTGVSVERTTVLAIDTSNSMRGARFAAAKQAASAFLSTVPDDVRVGVVSYAGEVVVAQEPTLDRDATQAVLDGLTLSQGTLLYDGITAALEAAGTEGQRTVLVLSDGRDTSATTVEDAVASIGATDATVDVIALQQRPGAVAVLRSLAEAGNGEVLEAPTPASLTTFFAAASRDLARQVEVRATLPADASREGDLSVTLDGPDGELSARAFAQVRTETAEAEAAPAPAPAAPAPAASGGQIPQPLMLGALVAVGVALAFLIYAAVAGGTEGRRREDLDDQIAAYGAEGTAATGADRTPARSAAASLAPANVFSHAKDATAQALAGNRTLEARIADRLEGAAIGLKPAEWVLLHGGIAVGAAMLGLLLGSGSPVLLVLFGVLGVILPWTYLGIRRSRRRKAFEAGLADTLQLMAGSLQAGLSLTQSVDTIVKEGAEPIAGEFRRVLVENRLGVNLEDALDEVAVRMESKDFAWVVMAVRIQREVGGNLAELLLTVAATLREREYLRRHVSALSAEGRLSAWILGGLPPGFLVYLVAVRGDYVRPLFTDPRGWVMLGLAAVLLGVGTFWMSRVIKVEV